MRKLINKIKLYETGKWLVPFAVFALSALFARFFLKPYIVGENYQMASMGFVVLSTMILSPVFLKIIYGKSNLDEIKPMIFPVVAGLVSPMVFRVFFSEKLPNEGSYKMIGWLITFLSVFIAFYLSNIFLKKGKK